MRPEAAHQSGLDAHQSEAEAAPVVVEDTRSSPFPEAEPKGFLANTMEVVMRASGVTALDHSVQETNVWLRAVAEQLNFEDRQYAYNALRAVLHALRDRLPPEVAVHLGAQLPMLVRGFYYEGWHMAGTPTKERSVQGFTDHVLQELPPKFPIDPLTVTRGVFEILWERLEPGEFAKLMDHLPASVRTLRS